MVGLGGGGPLDPPPPPILGKILLFLFIFFFSKRCQRYSLSDIPKYYFPNNSRIVFQNYSWAHFLLTTEKSPRTIFVLAKHVIRSNLGEKKKKTGRKGGKTVSAFAGHSKRLLLFNVFVVRSLEQGEFFFMLVIKSKACALNANLKQSCFVP